LLWLSLSLPAAAAAQTPWIGGGPEGGTVRSIVIAPTTPETVYAGTPGGVFKRTTGATRWTSASLGLTDIDVRVGRSPPRAGHFSRTCGGRS